MVLVPGPVCMCFVLFFPLNSGHWHPLGLLGALCLASAIHTLLSSRPGADGALINIRCSCVGRWAGGMEPNNKCEFGRLDYKDPSLSYM